MSKKHVEEKWKLVKTSPLNSLVGIETVTLEDNTPLFNIVSVIDVCGNFVKAEFNKRVKLILAAPQLANALLDALDTILEIPGDFDTGLIHEALQKAGLEDIQ